MKKDFMNAARKIGTFLAASVMALSVSFGAVAASGNTGGSNTLPLPAFPANFEVATYQGQKGCIPDDIKYKFAVMENEGIQIAGMHPLMDTARTGVHTMSFLYQPDKNYAYTLSVRGDGKQCVYNKLENVKFQDELSNIFSTVSVKNPLKPEDCNFDVQAVNICGSYEAVTGRLTRAGYEYNWQGTLADGYNLTLMTKGEQSFYLKTDNSNGATIITGIGKGSYEAYEVTSRAPGLVAKN